MDIRIEAEIRDGARLVTCRSAIVSHSDGNSIQSRGRRRNPFSSFSSFSSLYPCLYRRQLHRDRLDRPSVDRDNSRTRPRGHHAVSLSCVELHSSSGSLACVVPFDEAFGTRRRQANSISGSARMMVPQDFHRCLRWTLFILPAYVATCIACFSFALTDL